MLAYFGAAGETEAELANAMGFSSVERDLVKKSYVFERAFQVRRCLSRHRASNQIFILGNTDIC